MAIYKCKMCGGTLEIEQGTTVAVCDYCGTKQTLPRLDDERRANLYDRANHFRRNNDYDKAASIYEKILNEDTTDAEAYWSLVLCRYGIEYVEDPATHKRVPTVNRAQFTSVFDDGNYKSALQYADALQRALYEEEAFAINEIQKGILAISQKEEPFDVFICYKETDANGRRTQDSVLANDLYHQLTQEGFKVFFSRITLEDKLGTAYEPYIFAALNSAKVMVVLGTKPEHFNAVWVKNEWSRYLALVKQSGGKKVLIPAYRDMDPYDLPEEFSHLQAQDMSKLGFMQDLIRGIKKIASVEAPKPEPQEAPKPASASTNAAPLLRRAFMFLEDGDWEKADDFCEQVLNLEPENAQAYLGKLMAELHVHRPKDLPNCKRPFDGSNNYRKVLRFGDEQLSVKMKNCIKHINERNENERLTGIYSRAMNTMNAADTEAAYKSAAEIFKTIPGFKDADVFAKQCLEKAEVCRKDLIYKAGKAQMAGKTLAGYESAIQSFRRISGWKDADEQIFACQRGIDEIKAKEAAEQLEKERKAEAERAEQERKKALTRKQAEIRKKKLKKAAVFVVLTVVVVAAVIVLTTTVFIPLAKYNAAVNLYENGKYEEAISAFEAMGGYKDSSEMVKQCKEGVNNAAYLEALKLFESEEYEKAKAAFASLENYKDSKEMIEKCKDEQNDLDYKKAEQLFESGKYEEAIEAFKALNGYKDSTARVNETKFLYQKSLLSNATVGDTVFFGNYEQDNNTSNGKEKIEWLVLAKEKNRLFLISQYVLDYQKFDSAYDVDKDWDAAVTWENCSLRKWLNKTFLNAAFNSNEQSIIIDSTVTADPNPEYNTPAGNNTKDKVFLLSIAEAEQFFSSKDARICDDGNYIRCWWLRSPGQFAWYPSLVLEGGSIYSGENGGVLASDEYAVRPAIWIDLS